MVLDSAKRRKAAGCGLLLGYMALYAILAAAIGAALLPALPWWGALLYFAAAGIVWILPLKPLFGWMKRGR